MFAPRARVKVKATGETGTVERFYPEDDEYMVRMDAETETLDNTEYYYGGDLEHAG